MTDTSLSERRTNTRTGNGVVVFDLTDIKQHFDDAIGRIKEQFSVADKLLAEKNIEGAKTIWRAQIVFLASALDFYMHEITKYGTCAIYDKNWESTEKYKNIVIHMKDLEQAIHSKDTGDWFAEYITTVYQDATFMSYSAIKGQLNLLDLDVTQIANKAFYEQSSIEKPIDKLKRRVDELSHRRNLIAHQTDRSHMNAQYEDIDREMVESFLVDMEKVIVAIDEVAKRKNSKIN